MIMSLWSVFGVSQQVAMIVPYIIFSGVIGASIYLVRSLLPKDETAPLWMTALTLGSLPLLLYSNLILFDLLLSIFVIIGLASIWNFAQTGLRKHLIIFAICVGLGALAKGPVILLNLLFPIILARFWIPKNQMIVSRSKWVIGFFLAVLGGALIALSWAMPAAMKGGAEYTQKIFWGQTAGRVEQSFDHARPFWWYVQLLPLLLCPWILMPSLWRNLKNWSELSVYLPMNAIRFLAACIIPVFISFSFISGKQIHYLFPCLIGALAFIGIVLSHTRYELRIKDLWFPAAFVLLLTSFPAITKLFAVEMSELFNRHLMDDALMRMSATISLIGVAFSGALFFLVRQKAWHIQLASLAMAMVIFMSVFHLEASRGFYKNYDLGPMAKVITQYRDRPMAF
jgi:4-amino-4-deoxy-L-arabinose transferase-like glycosyltransferase